MHCMECSQQIFDDDYIDMGDGYVCGLCIDDVEGIGWYGEHTGLDPLY